MIIIINLFNMNKYWLILVCLMMKGLSLNSQGKDTAIFRVKLLNPSNLKLNDNLKIEFENTSDTTIKLSASALYYNISSGDSIVYKDGVLMIDMFCKDIQIISKMSCFLSLHAHSKDTLKVCLKNNRTIINAVKGDTLEGYFYFDAYGLLNNNEMKPIGEKVYLEVRVGVE